MAKKNATAKGSATSASDSPQDVSSKPEDNSTSEEAPPPKPKTPAKFAFHAIKIFDGIAIVFAVFIILIARFFRPGFWSTLLYALAGLPAGIAMSFLYFQRKRDKRSKRQLYNVEPGAKGVTELLQKIPTWLGFSDAEKCEWLNAVLLELWPFYDYAVCELIKEIVDPIFESIKPPGFKKISFRKLQFGDAPIRVESVKMNRSRKEGIFLEIDIRWAGDPDIQLAIDTLGAGEASQISPKISKIRIVGTLGVHLRPLVEEIPGFGAIIVTLLKPPKIKYQVNLGAALGGGVTAAPIVKFVDGLIPDILNGFLVWPQRIVVPMFGEDVIGPLEDYMLRHQGVLKVEVLEAREIPKMDALGSSDPLVKVFTDPKRVVKTATKKNTLNPVWENEVFYLMVQEPETQYLRFEMFDVDFVSVKAFTKLKLTKAVTDTFGAEESMGKGEVFLHDVCVNHPGETVDRWFPLGSEDWSADDGPGKGCGELKLRLTYVPLPRVNPMVGQLGNLFVSPKGGKDFPMMVPKSPKSTSSYYVAKVGSESKNGPVKFSTVEPDWTGTSVAFYGVSNSELLKLTFYHQSALGLDAELGEISVEISDVRKAVHREQKGCMRRQYDLQDADSGSIELELLFVPEF